MSAPGKSWAPDRHDVIRIDFDPQIEIAKRPFAAKAAPTRGSAGGWPVGAPPVAIALVGRPFAANAAPAKAGSGRFLVGATSVANDWQPIPR